MQTSVEALRKYPFGSLAFHTLGYVSLTDEVTAEDVPGANLPAKDNFTYQGMKGKAGLEQRCSTVSSAAKPGAKFGL